MNIKKVSTLQYNFLNQKGSFVLNYLFLIFLHYKIVLSGFKFLMGMVPHGLLVKRTFTE
ncbi:MAG: hypothetical protein Metus_1265 [Candidatus Methanosuratincola subterraneus]|uniref:Uncharacterized protein n=1 Tax=Methanosuratincola subterraneus TaxID=2593994 RepID=A0A444L6S3_METS7|nr:MAG: hypothetical protein Metus_1265 [Candidatus Methanosuratincola subterraneus]